MTYNDIEIAVVHLFGVRQHIILPNLSWAILNSREADLVILKPSGHCTEIEIKQSFSDFKADFKKRHRKPGYSETFFRQLYYAIPNALTEKVMPLLPGHAGLIIVHDVDNPYAQIKKKAPVNKEALPRTTEQQFNIMRLACMRLWTAKEQVNSLRKINKQWKK